MASNPIFELFVLKCSALNADLTRVLERYDPNTIRGTHSIQADEILKDYIPQIDNEIQRNAAQMAEYYRIFYMLENYIRNFVSDMLETEVGSDWWDKSVPQVVKDAAKKSRDRELSMGVTPRSVNMIEYTTFGELGEIMKANWTHFSGTLNQKGMENVLGRLNTVRGPIMHCGVLAEDEVLRLKLSVRDWFKLFGG